MTPFLEFIDIRGSKSFKHIIKRDGQAELEMVKQCKCF